jgi:hypothetical protein
MTRSRLASIAPFMLRRGPFLPVLTICLLVFAVTADWDGPDHIDPYTNALTAWYLATTGSPVMTEHQAATDQAHRGNLPWVVMSPRGPISQYPPGTAVLAVPISAVWPGTLVPARMGGTTRPDAAMVDFPVAPRAPSIIVGVVSSALAAAMVASIATAVRADPLQGLVAGLVYGCCTGLWSVASQQLWQHGPGAMFVAGSVLAASKNRLVVSGGLAAASVLVRPHLVLIAVGISVALAVDRRSVRPLLEIGGPTAVGVLALLTYNHWIWGELTISGGYGASFVTNLQSADLASFLRNVGLAFLDWRQGLLTVSPMLVALFAGLPFVFRKAPPWARGAAIGSVVYLLVQLKANRFTGGGGFFGYRYPIEPLAGASAVLYLAWADWVAPRSRWNKAFRYGCIVALVGQGIGAFWI